MLPFGVLCVYPHAVEDVGRACLQCKQLFVQGTAPTNSHEGTDVEPSHVSLGIQCRGGTPGDPGIFGPPSLDGFLGEGCG